MNALIGDIGNTTTKICLIEFKTFRRRGHEEASGTKYVPQELMSEWEAKDPIENTISTFNNSILPVSSIKLKSN